MKWAGILAGTALALSMAAGAHAADLGPVQGMAPVAVPVSAYSWTGFYVGIHGGYAWSNSDASTVGVVPGAGAGGAPLVVRSGVYSFNGDGGLVGGQVGYNYELANRVLLGLEGEFAWSNVSGSFQYDPLRANARAGGKIDYQGTLRARLGYDFDRFLPYVTGGLAYAHQKAFVNNYFTGVAGGEHDTGSEDTWGWTVGVGVEYAITQNISAKVEYLHMDYGNVDIDLPMGGGAPAGSVIHSHSHSTQDVVQAGLNYRFW